MDQIQTVKQFFCASLGRSLCHGNKDHGIDPNVWSSGHHESWLFQQGCLSLHSWQTAILPYLVTLNSAYWALSTFHSFEQQALVVLWSVHKGVPKQTSTNYLRRKQACKLMHQIWTVQQFCATPERSFCHGNEHHGIDPSIFSSGPSWLFHKGCLSLHSCQTAILSHAGALNSANWAFSTFQSALIWAIALVRSVVLSSSFLWKQPANYPWANLVSSVYICLFPWESFSTHTVFISICGKTE